MAVLCFWESIRLLEVATNMQFWSMIEYVIDSYLMCFRLVVLDPLQLLCDTFNLDVDRVEDQHWIAFLSSFDQEILSPD